MPSGSSPQTTKSEVDELVDELEKAEAYEQRLRQFIVDARDKLASGDTSVALSNMNEALRYIDCATDVVAPTKEDK